jgi:hypothetical protein
MPSPAKAKRAVYLLLLSLAPMAAGADGPTPGAKAKACMKIESRPSRTTPGCTKFVFLVNTCQESVVARVRETQHLFSGPLRQDYTVALPGRTERALGCAWWNGATAPSGYDLLSAAFAAEQRGGESTTRGGSGRR